ncbi:hypothetical protein DYU05_04525 [Mucilaginibacter terrenus]|uniref:DUF975 family protein n=1 Tax=Mucilaginibacter terrenus TaxID=2482727 RepID=A0A3E2NV27_9SPHI|nr:hypothetical protein [Mucilaginibacter terrenus]RFZ84876.1 hypothetical protein DYU05_04525 [Mucilaginibacter terrenus]
MYHPFSVGETLKTSWDLLKKNFAVIIIYSILSFLLLIVIGVIISFTYSPSEKDFAGTMIVSFIGIFVQAFTTLGLYKLIFTVIDNEYYEFEFKQIVPTFKMVLSYLGVIFILAFIITNVNIGLDYLEDDSILRLVITDVLTLVGLYFALRIMFFNTFIVDDASGPIESIKQSFDLTKGYILKVVLILLSIIIFIAIPAWLSQYFPLISITIVFTYPFVNIILAVTYRKLIYSHQDVDDDIAETN